MAKEQYSKKFFVDNTKKMFKDIFSGDKERFKKQFANLLTMSRGILAPILIIISLILGNLTMSLIVIAISALTDCFDGWYARHFNYVSEFGALLDTVCDKIFILCVILPVLKTNIKMFLIILCVELLISIINCYSNFKKGKRPKSSIIGKIKTIILDATLILCYLNNIIEINNKIITVFLYITIAFQVIACIDYLKNITRK